MPYADPAKRKEYHKNYITPYMREYRKTDKFKDSSSEYRSREVVKERLKVYGELYRQTESGIKSMRRSSWKKQGISCTEELYDSMMEAQGGSCKICGKHHSTLKARLAVDHCHTTGNIRGLLCTSCNTKLSFYEKYADAITKYVQT